MVGDYHDLLQRDFPYRQPRGYWTERVYTLVKQDGEKVVLSSYQLEDVTKLIDVLKRRVYALLLPLLQQAYAASQNVTFSPVTVNKQDGLQDGGKRFAWADVLKVEVKNGSLLVTMKQSGVLGGHHSVRASKIPNVEMLCQLIRLDPWTIDPAHL